MRITACRMPDFLAPRDAAWNELAQHLIADRSDLLLLNEMPFGPWIAGAPQFDPDVARASVELHEAALPAFADLRAAVIATRPVLGPEKLANEAFLLADG